MQMWKYRAVCAFSCSSCSTLMRSDYVLASNLFVDRVCSFYYSFFNCIFFIFELCFCFLRIAFGS